mmetsp:Transcript_12697/g.21382  ORF Transcript_12697/g.21382 Transcript_12697/m.21382 type:complete len:123 (+) Transcript_12697:1313-1681(+)
MHSFDDKSMASSQNTLMPESQEDVSFIRSSQTRENGFKSGNTVLSQDPRQFEQKSSLIFQRPTPHGPLVSELRGSINEDQESSYFPNEKGEYLIDERYRINSNVSKSKTLSQSQNPSLSMKD